MDETPFNDPARRAEIIDLLLRYPDLEPAETEDLLTFLATGAIIDIGYLTGDPELKPIIDRVRQDHARRFRPGIGQTLVLFGMFIVPLVALCWYALSVSAK